MRKIGLILGCALCFCAAVPSMAATIPFSDSPKIVAREALLGVEVAPTGPMDVPPVDGGWEVLGATSPFRNNSTPSHFYSGSATFSQPTSRVTLDAQRANNSGWTNLITFTAFDQGRQVASQTIDLKPLGDGTQITLSAPAIDSVSWGGEGWVFHPYYVMGLEAKLGAQSVGGIPTPPVSSQAVGSPAPEPAPSLAFIFLLLPILRRPTSR